MPKATVKETVVRFGQQRSVIGILTEGEQQRGIGVLLLNAGFLYRVGPNRIYVKIARKMAELGCVALRYDFSGIGDSPFREDYASFDECVITETKAAIDYLRCQKNVDKIILLGLCLGADISFRIAAANPGVTGAILINGSYLGDKELEYVLPEARRRRNYRYYKKHLSDYRKWPTFITGDNNICYTIPATIISYLKKIIKPKQAAIQREILQSTTSDWQQLMKKEVRVLLLYWEGCVTFDLYHMMTKKILSSIKKDACCDIKVIMNADHTFTKLQSQHHAIDSIYRWLEKRIVDHQS